MGVFDCVTRSERVKKTIITSSGGTLGQWRRFSYYATVDEKGRKMVTPHRAPHFFLPPAQRD